MEFAGKGKLTHSMIDILPNYYGTAIRSNSGNLKIMKSNILQVFGSVRLQIVVPSIMLIALPGRIAGADTCKIKQRRPAQGNMAGAHL